MLNSFIKCCKFVVLPAINRHFLKTRMGISFLYTRSRPLVLPGTATSQFTFCTKSIIPEAEDNIKISRFPVTEVDTLPEDIQERINEVKEKSGFIPNVFKALAHRPDEFRAFFSYYDAIMTQENSSLTKAEKEMIVVVTSAANNCTYCVVAHGAVLRIYAKKPLLADQVAICWEHADINERERMILDLATTVGKGHPVSDALINKMIEFGFTMDDVWDIGAVASFFAMSNRLAHTSKMKANKEFYTMGRFPKEKKKE